ncbi:DUF4124 domain-containing protein [Roseateles sp. BYS87W]|uniref:DUF4124 domain-containing protein n=1 Tax=Pelomonas baiyunensis TaxID=3299026 RepID=A0ABW7GZ15_9BURK
MNLKHLALAAGLLAGAWNANAAVYRCTDAQGKVTYQAQPCDGGATAPGNRTLEVETRPSAPAPAPRRSPVMPFDVPAGPAPRADDPVRPPVARPAPRVVEPAAAPAGMAQWGTQADTMAVSGYEFTAGNTQVLVDHPARPVLLVLSSYHSTAWQVRVAPGTQLVGIVVGSHDRQTTVQGPAQVPVVTDELPYAYEADNLNFRQLIRRLNSRYGVTQLTALRGSYTLPPLTTLRGPFVADPVLTLEGIRPEPTRYRMNFTLLSQDGRRLPWTNTGPRDGARFNGIVRGGGIWAWGKGGPAAVRDDGREAFVLEGNGGTLLWMPEGPQGPKQKMDWPSSLPPLSWGSALAWDQAQGVLALVSFGGEGFFYRYDTRRKVWLGATSLKDRDLTGLAFDPDTRRYVGVTVNAELIVFNGQGETLEVLPLGKQLADLGSVYDRGNARLDSLDVAVQGQLVAVFNVREATVTHIWTYDLRTRKAQLTYKALE